MGHHSDILLILALILVAGKLASTAGQRFGLPEAVGKITVGLLIGPAVLGFVHESETLSAFSQIGVVVLMFLAGMETDMATMRQVSISALIVALGGVVLPFVGGFAVGEAFDLGLTESLFLGAILTATSVSITAQTLRELGLLQGREGTMILAAAVIDDIMGVIVLAFVFASTGSGDPVTSIGQMALFIPGALLLGYFLSGPISDRLEAHFSTESQLAIVVAGALVYAWGAEAIGGVAAVTGAYMAGLLIARTHLVHTVSDGLNWVAYGFFVPVFFVGIGTQADFAAVAEAPGLLVALTVVAVLGKIVGCYLTARITKTSHKGSLLIGVGMMSRGEVALVIAAAGLANGTVGQSVFSASIIMTLVTTILTPILLKVVAASGGGPQSESSNNDYAFASDAVPSGEAGS
jgi:Kef-type K+ transport system membrane component KefB